jgi:signal transduction histidine kinase
MAEAIEALFSAADLEREKLAALKQFAYGLSHEINNPLTNIATRAQMLLAGESDPARRKALETINSQAFRAFEMLADLMLFAHPPALAMSRFDLGEMLREVVQQFAPAARDQRTELILMPGLTCPTEIQADRAQMAAAVGALIRNGLEALRTGGAVEVLAAEYDSEDGHSGWDVSVRDNGPGITPEIRRHLFDPFFSGREAGRGLGLGLCKVWRVAEMHRGEVIVSSELGRGSDLTLRIPQPENPRRAD